MLDIVILYFLLTHIGRLAVKKNQPVFRWRMRTLLAWIAGAFVGIMIAMLFYEIKDPSIILKSGNAFLSLKLLIFQYLFAVMGYHLVLTTLKRIPDAELPHEEGSIL